MLAGTIRFRKLFKKKKQNAKCTPGVASLNDDPFDELILLLTNGSIFCHGGGEELSQLFKRSRSFVRRRVSSSVLDTGAAGKEDRQYVWSGGDPLTSGGNCVGLQTSHLEILIRVFCVGQPSRPMRSPRMRRRPLRSRHQVTLFGFQLHQLLRAGGWVC